MCSRIHPRRTRPFVLALTLLLCHPGTRAQLASTPPMGWNSWNHFGIHFTDQDVRNAADALATNGMKQAGYIYVNIDDGWQGERAQTGELHGNRNFPDMKALTAYVHAKGLKVGIYSTPGAKSCDGFTGGKGHEQQRTPPPSPAGGSTTSSTTSAPFARTSPAKPTATRRSPGP